MAEILVLDNGLRIILVPIEAIRSVTISFFIGIGSRYESLAEGGAAHFIEHLLFKGTARRPSAQMIAETVEGLGGLINAATDLESTTLWAKVAGHHLVETLDVLVDMLRFSGFTPENVEKERQVILEELKMYYDTPDDWVDVLLSQTLWPDHPLGKDIAGTPESVAALGREVLCDFYQRTYHPANCVLVVAGYFERSATLEALRLRLDNWQPLPLPTFVPAPQTPLSVRFAWENRPIEQGHLNLNTPGLDRFHPDRFSLALLNTLLGEGMSSRLFLKIREELGAAYDVGSSLGFLADTGMLTIYSGVDPDRGTEALRAILIELDRLTQKSVPQEELNKAREYLKGRIILSLESSSGQAGWYGQQLLYHNKIETLETILEYYDAVTTADIQRVAQLLFNPHEFILAAVGPFENGMDLAKLIE